jgi:hypothetical protein
LDLVQQVQHVEKITLVRTYTITILGFVVSFILVIVVDVNRSEYNHWHCLSPLRDGCLALSPTHFCEDFYSWFFLAVIS